MQTCERPMHAGTISTSSYELRPCLFRWPYFCAVLPPLWLLLSASSFSSSLSSEERDLKETSNLVIRVPGSHFPHHIWLWVFVFVKICSRNKFLWLWLSKALIYEFTGMSLESFYLYKLFCLFYFFFNSIIWFYPRSLR